MADLRMEVNQGAPGSGLMGPPSVSVSVTNKPGVIVFSGDSELAWTAVYQRMAGPSSLIPERPDSPPYAGRPLQDRPSG
jgi:hypothetical protein